MYPPMASRNEQDERCHAVPTSAPGILRRAYPTDTVAGRSVVRIKAAHAVTGPSPPAACIIAVARLATPI